MIPLMSKANDDDISLLMATDLVPDPSFTFWLRDMSFENAVGPLNVMVDPLSVNAPAAEMSTDVDVPFPILIASFFPMVMVCVDVVPLAIFTFPAVVLLFAIFNADEESFIPVIMLSTPLDVVNAPVAILTLAVFAPVIRFAATP